MPDAPHPIKVFYAYAQEDEPWVQELEKHLRLFQRQKLISTWHTRLIKAGEDWHHLIDTHLQTASVVLLLISPDFLASDYCYGAEMKRVLAREQAKGVRLIPILLRPVDWQNTPFAYLQPLPSNATFLTEWKNLDRAFTEVAVGIRRAIIDLSLLSTSFSRTSFPRLWNIPFAYNPFFTGREDLLSRLHAQLHIGQTAALSQPQAISGLGGIGKTQLAVEYAYRFHQEYQAVLWVHAENIGTLNSSYTEIAALLGLSVESAQDQTSVIRAVRTWLQTHQGWLLILDNADEMNILPPFLPPRLGGHLILTTRSAAPGRIARRILVETFSEEQGMLFLLRRTGLLDPDGNLLQALPEDQALARQITQEVGGLPLALDQIGSYIEATGCNFATYQQHYLQHQAELLEKYNGGIADHPEPVATTWSLSFQHVEERDPAAAELLRLCAFLAPDALEEEMLRQGADTLGPVLAPVMSDDYLLNRSIEVLRAYSLIDRDVHTKALTMHRLVQVVLRNSLSLENQKLWMQRAIAVVNIAFLNVEFAMWPKCERRLPHALRCVQWIEYKENHSLESAHLLDQTGVYLTARSRLKEAEQVLQKALLIREIHLDSDHLDIATSLHNLAIFYEEQDKYTEAELVCQRALAIREKHLGADHPDTAKSLNTLAHLYEKQSKYEEAKVLTQRALAICEKHLGTDHPETANSLHNLALIYRKLGRYVEAKQLGQRALTIRKEQLGDKHPDTTNSLSNQGLIYERLGKYIEAEALFLQNLAIREEQLGARHLWTGISLSNLALIYERLGKYDEAEPLGQQALAICEEHLGEKALWTALSLNDLARLYTRQGKYKEAEPLFQRALAIREEQLGVENTWTALSLNDLARLYTRQGKYKEAEPLFQRALAIREKQLGSNHPETATSLNDLGSLYHTQGKNEQAVLLLQHSLDIRERALGPEHPDTATSLYSLAAFYADQGKYAEAEPLYKQALAICQRVLGDEHPTTQTIKENYAWLLNNKEL
jgi:tetratricopeptide (TPR) repeat protein